VAELVIDGSDVRYLSGQKQPTRSDVECVGECLHPLRRIVFWIDRNGNEEEVASDCTIKLVLQLRHLGCSERTEILATRVDEADDDDLAFDHVVIKSQCSAILVDYGHVGEVVRPPSVPWPLGRGLRGGSRLRLEISCPACLCCTNAVLRCRRNRSTGKGRKRLRTKRRPYDDCGRDRYNRDDRGCRQPPCG